MISINSQNPVDPIFGAVIHTYTRAQAIADGVLVDATIGDLAEVTRQHHGNADVAMTAAVFDLMRKAVENPNWSNDYKGVWHDILWMARCHGFPKRGDDRLFKLIITGTGRKRYHVLRIMGEVINGRITITVMLPTES